MNALNSVWKRVFGSNNQDSTEPHSVASNVAGEEEKVVNTGDINESGKRDEDDRVYYECGEKFEKHDDENLSTMDESELEVIGSNVPECTPLKLLYDECFTTWFASSYLQGTTSPSPCDVLLDEYAACVKKGLNDQGFVMFQSSCRFSTDPDDGRVDHPRDCVPPGASYHHGQ